MHWNFQDFNKYKKQFKKLCQEAEFQESFIEWSTLAEIAHCGTLAHPWQTLWKVLARCSGRAVLQFVI